MLRRVWWKTGVPGTLHPHEKGDIVCASAVDFLGALRDCCADIVFLDPPFNLGKRYGGKARNSDRLSDDEYFDSIRRVLEGSTRVLKEGGALYLYHIPRWAIRLAPVLEEALEFRHWIAVSMKNGFPRPKHLYPAHYALLYFTKGKPSHFSRPKVPLQSCRNCGRPVKDYGGYKRFVADGVNLSDVWEDISPVRHRKYKHRQSNELPLEIPRRAVEISGVRNGVLVDPFAGAGTSLVAALERNMRFIACDDDPECCDIIVTRLHKKCTLVNASGRQGTKS